MTKRTNIKYVWANRKSILEGIRNDIFKKDDVEKVAALRMEICNSCEHIDREGSKCYVPGTQPCCGLCGCKLAWKTRSLSEKCDIDKWEDLLNEEEESELYDNINYNPDEE